MVLFFSAGNGLQTASQASPLCTFPALRKHSRNVHSAHCKHSTQISHPLPCRESPGPQCRISRKQRKSMNSKGRHECGDGSASIAERHLSAACRATSASIATVIRLPLARTPPAPTCRNCGNRRKTLRGEFQMNRDRYPIIPCVRPLKGVCGLFRERSPPCPHRSKNPSREK